MDSKLKAFVDGVTVRGLCDAVRAGDIDAVRAMLVVRPELVYLDVAENDEQHILSSAVEDLRIMKANGEIREHAEKRKSASDERYAASEDRSPCLAWDRTLSSEFEALVATYARARKGRRR